MGGHRTDGRAPHDVSGHTAVAETLPLARMTLASAASPSLRNLRREDRLDTPLILPIRSYFSPLSRENSVGADEAPETR